VSKRAAGDQPLRHIRVVDLGVSHGVQWPTLLDALTRVPWGSTLPSIRLTITSPTATPPAPFAMSPPGYYSVPQLLRTPGPSTRHHGLDTLHGVTTSSEVLIVCVQFRISHYYVPGRNGAEERRTQE
jgi:hypothetical protein